MLDTGENPDAPLPREMIDLEVSIAKYLNTEKCNLQINRWKLHENWKINILPVWKYEYK